MPTTEQEIRNLNDDLAINKHNLPYEWERQPQLYMYWADEYAYAIMDRDRIKGQLELTAADLNSQIRTNPDEYGLTKVVNDTVDAAVKAHPLYLDGVESLHQANLIVNRMAAAKTAMEHKKRALDHLTTLAVNEFYSYTAGTKPETHVNMGKTSQQRYTEHMDTKKQERGIIT